MRFFDAEKLAEKARQSIGKFCAEECRAYCCRTGNLTISKEESAVFDHQILTKTDKGFLTNLKSPGCPHLEKFKCRIYQNPLRPLACREFPLFIRGNTVLLSHRCLAVKTGLFYPYIKQFQANGIRVIESDQMYDSEFYTIFGQRKI